jgi:hypothetical protein
MDEGNIRISKKNKKITTLYCTLIFPYVGTFYKYSFAEKQQTTKHVLHTQKIKIFAKQKLLKITNSLLLKKLASPIKYFTIYMLAKDYYFLYFTRIMDLFEL